jgi:holo-ACP synthase
VLKEESEDMRKGGVRVTQDFYKKVFAGPSVSLEDMLWARERRATLQRRLCVYAPSESSLLSMTLRIPGPHKSSSVFTVVFDSLVSAINETLSTQRVFNRIRLNEATGPELLETVECNAFWLKRTMVAVEQFHPLGTLVDLDVFDIETKQFRPLSRTEIGYPLRTCLVCGGPAKLCARSRAHSVEEMQQCVASIIQASMIREEGLKNYA